MASEDELTVMSIMDRCTKRKKILEGISYISSEIEYTIKDNDNLFENISHYFNNHEPIPDDLLVENNLLNYKVSRLVNLFG